MDLVEISNLHARPEVGFSPHEIRELQEIFITIQLKTPRKAGNTDCIIDALNLKTITKDVLFHVENKKYNLIEAVAIDVARICVVRHGVQWVKVNVKKPNALRFSDYSAVTIERTLDDFEWSEVHVSIGSNISPFHNIPEALEMLKERAELVEISKAFRTTPVGFKDQDDFVNMAVVLKTKLGPEGLKMFLIDVERRLGRIRDAKNKSGPRTIDLDISFWGDSVLDYKILRDSKIKTSSVPDPDILKHAHVIVPLAVVTPEFTHPVTKQSLRTIASDVCGTNDFESLFPTVPLKSLNTENDHVTTPDFVTQNGYITNSPVIQDAVPKRLKTEVPVALVTGAAKRLGATIARQLHAAGYNIMIHYNTSEAQAKALSDELNSIRENSARLVQADLTSAVQLTAEKLIGECTQIWGRLDLLVNNASQFNPTEVGNVGEKDWDNIIKANLGAPFFLSQSAYPSLKSSHGCIINILDIHAYRPLSSHSVYCISKAGLKMCTLALAKDFAPHVRVNGVAPGAILWKESEEGACGSEAIEAKHKEILKKIPMGRRGEASDIATMVEFLACNARYVTGQVISVDGGRTLNQ